MVTVRGEDDPQTAWAERHRGPRGKMDGSAADARSPSPSREADHGSQLRRMHTLSRWERTGTPRCSGRASESPGKASGDKTRAWRGVRASYCWLRLAGTGWLVRVGTCALSIRLLKDT